MDIISTGLAPPITVGLLSGWKRSHDGKIVFADSKCSSLYFYKVVVQGYPEQLHLFSALCDAISTGLLINPDKTTPLHSVQVSSGFLDFDDPATLKALIKSRDAPLTDTKFLERRLVWLEQLGRRSVDRSLKPGYWTPDGADVEGLLQGARSSEFPMRFTGYVQGMLATLWCFNTAPVETVTVDMIKPNGLQALRDCSFLFRSPREHALRHGSPLALLTLAAAALGGAVVGSLRGRRSKERARVQQNALLQLSYLAPLEVLDATMKRLALDASDRLVPAVTVDQGAGAVVRWIRARTPSWWKRYTPAALAVGAAIVAFDSDIARSAATVAAVALVTQAAAAGSPQHTEKERTGIKLHTEATRRRLLARADDTVFGLLGKRSANLRTMPLERMRYTIIEAMPRALEILFTDPHSGQSYPQRMVLQRLVLFPGLLRPQLYTEKKKPKRTT